MQSNPKPRFLRVFVVEDDPDWIDIYSYMAKECGFTIVLAARTLEQALDFASKVREYAVDVALLDGNLGSGGTADGQAVYKKIKEFDSQVVTIGMSVNPLPFTDIDISKASASQLKTLFSELALKKHAADSHSDLSLEGKLAEVTGNKNTTPADLLADG